MTVIARGAKARGALKRHNLTPNFQAEPPTTEGLVKLVEGTRCPGQVAVALARDQPSSALGEAVERGGGHADQFAPYHYRQPTDLREIGVFVQRGLEATLAWWSSPPRRR